MVALKLKAGRPTSLMLLGLLALIQVSDSRPSSCALTVLPQDDVLHVLPGTDVTFICNATCLGPLSRDELSWKTPRGERVTSGSRSRLQSIGYDRWMINRLVVRRTRAEDSGIYTCEINHQGHEYQYSVHLIVKGPEQKYDPGPRRGDIFIRPIPEFGNIRLARSVSSSSFDPLHPFPPRSDPKAHLTADIDDNSRSRQAILNDDVSYPQIVLENDASSSDQNVLDGDYTSRQNVRDDDVNSRQRAFDDDVTSRQNFHDDDIGYDLINSYKRDSISRQNAPGEDIDFYLEIDDNDDSSSRQNIPFGENKARPMIDRYQSREDSKLIKKLRVVRQAPKQQQLKTSPGLKNESEIINGSKENNQLEKKNTSMDYMNNTFVSGDQAAVDLNNSSASQDYHPDSVTKGSIMNASFVPENDEPAYAESAGNDSVEINQTSPSHEPINRTSSSFENDVRTNRTDVVTNTNNRQSSPRPTEPETPSSDASSTSTSPQSPSTSDPRKPQGSDSDKDPIEDNSGSDHDDENGANSINEDDEDDKADDQNEKDDESDIIDADAKSSAKSDASKEDRGESDFGRYGLLAFFVAMTAVVILVFILLLLLFLPECQRRRQQTPADGPSGKDGESSDVMLVGHRQHVNLAPMTSATGLNGEYITSVDLDEKAEEKGEEKEEVKYEPGSTEEVKGEPGAKKTEEQSNFLSTFLVGNLSVTANHTNGDVTSATDAGPAPKENGGSLINAADEPMASTPLMETEPGMFSQDLTKEQEDKTPGETRVMVQVEQSPVSESQSLPGADEEKTPGADDQKPTGPLENDDVIEKQEKEGESATITEEGKDTEKIEIIV